MENVLEKLKQLGLSCNSCWWQEGGRCYKEPCERIKIEGRSGSYSTKFANELCEHHSSKRAMLSKFFPPGMLVIQSEENEKKKGNDSGIY